MYADPQSTQDFLHVAVGSRQDFRKSRGWDQHLFASIGNVLHQRIDPIASPFHRPRFRSFVDLGIREQEYGEDRAGECRGRAAAP